LGTDMTAVDATGAGSPDLPASYAAMIDTTYRAQALVRNDLA
jgi:hypothetical protein